MKSTIVACAIKLAIAVLNYVLNRYCSGKTTNYIQDVQINETAAKMLTEFIKSHTKTVADDKAAEKSEETAEKAEAENA